MSRRLMLRNASGGGGILPPEYQQVEWIESNGSQLIILGIMANSREDLVFYNFTCTFSIPILNSSTGIIFSFFSNPGYWFGNVSRTKIGLSPSVTFNSINISEKNTVSLSWDTQNVLSKCKTETISRTTGTFYKDATFTLFGDFQNLYCAKCRIYSAQIDYRNEMIRNVIPCYRKSDGEIGMYDTVSQTFFANAGTGSFTKGADVN